MPDDLSMSDDLITVGKISAHYGVKGWLKIFSFTQPMENIANYSTWYVGGEVLKGIKSKRHGKTMIALFKGCANRESAQRYIGAEIRIERQALSVLQDGEYYWHQLIGLNVIDTAGQSLGRIDSLFETGANDVLVIKRDDKSEILIPYIDSVIKTVDIDKGSMLVDWDPSFLE